MSFPSPSLLPEAQRVEVAALLAPVAYALWGLAGISRKAHLNVKGMAFGPLHALFGTLYKAANDQADVIAEHITLVAGITLDADHIDVAEKAGITRMPASITAGRDLARAVGDRVMQALAVINAPKARLLEIGDDDAQQKVLDASMAVSKWGGQILAHLG